MRTPLFEDTAELAKRIRIHVLHMTSSGGSAHVGACFSMADIISVLYGKYLNVHPTAPTWKERDRFILSKGHAGACLYAALAECRFFPISNLKTHYQNGSKLSGHVSHIDIPGVEFSTGSLGHGLPVAAGMAMAALMDGHSNRVVCLLSDGECDEGSVWEAALFAAHHKLKNLVAIIDYNKIQSLASVDETLALEPFADKWSAFGWKVFEVDGHNHEEILMGLTKASDVNGPSVLLAHTTKGKGVSFMENSVLWHYRTAKDKEFDDALQELMAL